MNTAMKQYIIGAMFILALLTGCDLDKTPLAALSPETFFSNEQELRLYSNKFYSDVLPSAASLYGENADDLVITPLSAAISGQRTVPATGGGWDWEALRRINYLLANSHQTADLAVRNQYNALARFFRAYFYFEKLKRFGEVPWFNTVLGSQDPNLFKPRDSRTLIADSILRDLDFAIDNLSEVKDVYRVNRWTALALKSRMALFEGTFRTYHGMPDAERYLNSCVEASKILIDNGGYTLYKTGAQPYRDLFANTKAIAQEVILARDYDEGLGLLHDAQNFENSSTRGRPGLAKSVVNYYLTTSGGRFTDIPNYDKLEFVEETRNRDPRLPKRSARPVIPGWGAVFWLLPILPFLLPVIT